MSLPKRSSPTAFIKVLAFDALYRADFALKQELRKFLQQPPTTTM